MTQPDYADERYCPLCKRLVHYLTAGERSYCVNHPGKQVSVFGPGKRAEFNRLLAEDNKRSRKNYLGGCRIPSSGDLAAGRKRLNERLHQEDERRAVRTC